MKKVLLSITLSILSYAATFAQQDPMFTKYMFNSLAFNPAYAGAKDHLSATLIHRDQWWGINGAPKTQSFTIHTPLESDRVGLGLSVTNDKIGPTNSMSAMASYAYRIKVGEGKLCVGMQAGILNWRADFNKLKLENGTDMSFMNDMTPSMWLPNFGAGVHYYLPNKFYVGIASPNIIEHDYNSETNGAMGAKQFRHYYFMAGGVIRLNSSMVFKPSLLVKNVGLFGEFKPDTNPYAKVGAPTEFDLDASMLFYDALWAGIAFRAAFEGFTGSSSFDSGDIWVSYYLRNGFRVGVAYDFTLTELRPFAQGSYEVMLGYEMNYKEKQIVTPRYF